MTFIKEQLSPSLTKEETDYYFLKYKEGDMTAREKLILHNLRLVSHLIKRINISHEEKQELFSFGVEGLIKAVDTFDIEKGYCFSTYSVKVIRNYINLYFNTKKQILETISLEEQLSQENEKILLKDRIIDEENNIVENYEKNALKERVKELAIELNENERYCLLSYYGAYGYKKLSQTQIAYNLNISQAYVSKIIIKALNKLRKELIEEELIIPKKLKKLITN